MHYRVISNRSSHLKVFNVREPFTLMRLKIIKHDNPISDQRIVGLIYYVYLNKLYLSSTIKVVFL